jgi:hypothetical protein
LQKRCKCTPHPTEAQRCNLKFTGVAIGSGLWETVGMPKKRIARPNEKRKANDNDNDNDNELIVKVKKQKVGKATREDLQPSCPERGRRC